ncbi:serine protease [Rhodanobacter panaciterrae]|uniref:Serine protease n=1 Tax=Rhodanobacter panaciterrae TaxID=490572 RepID=A0ABQ3A1C2_9GAMM|nr:PA domain-containing protein [Rhodanobacter panaciterrae]GGY32388.1 serine protease [Rhodanobacter panaciterrae]
MIRRNKLFAALMVAGVLSLAGNAMAATLTVINKDPAGQGLNDPKPAAPIGGNVGTTRGEQARIVFEFAANMWGAVLKSDGPIAIDAKFSPLQCDSTGVVLGSTGTNGTGRFTVANGVPPGAKADIWYPGSMVNMFIGGDASPTQSEMTMSFNGALGSTCLPDGGWYFGLDGNTPQGQNNLLNVMLHEMGHGLGFNFRSNLTSGALSGGFDDIWTSFMYDNQVGKAWAAMTNAERVASVKRDGTLVFRGPNVVAQAPLALGKPPVLKVTAPAAAAGDYVYAAAAFGPTPTPANFNGSAVVAADPTGLACEALTNASDIAGHIAIVTRGTCGFAVKARNAEAAGASAVIIANNVPGVLTAAGDTLPNNIPTILVSDTDGAKLKANTAGSSMTLGLGTGLAGADANGNVLIYTPTVVSPGSTLSHFDTRLSPNALMEPFESSDLKGHINLDLSPAMYKDEGWVLNETGQMLLSCNTGVPTWVPGGSVIGANVYAKAKNLAASAANIGTYRASMQAYAADLATQELVTAQQATSLNACLSNAETQKQYRAWSPFAPATLQNGLTVAGQSGKAGSAKIYELDVPSGAIALTLRTLGGTGDVSIYVKVGEAADPTNYTYKSVHAGTNAESVLIARPAAGTYSVTVYGETDYSGVSVLGSFANTPQ